MRITKRLNLTKAAGYAIAINAVQIALVCAILLYALFSPKSAFSTGAERFVLSAMSLITCWGAYIDIRDAVGARRIAREADMLEESNDQLDELNLTLRAQRHDFMNHIQVVYGLIEMDERQSAIDYLDTVYTDLQRVGRALKTRSPAVNALLAAKLADGERLGVKIELTVQSAWENLPMEPFEICRVLGNLIDNAFDALKDTQNPEIRIELTETLRAYGFSVSNNGPEIDEGIRERVFLRGFSTKRPGRGMGLSIVRTLIEENGGEIVLTSDARETRFTGTLPKQTDHPPKEP